MKSFISHNPKETFEYAREMAMASSAGDIIGLIGDLGAGKTIFAKGFAEGLGIDEPVTSPTFTILCEYRRGRIPLFHFDMYRIEDADELFEIGWEEYIYGDGICLVEWANIITEELPPETVIVTIDRAAGDVDLREINISTLREWKEGKRR